MTASQEAAYAGFARELGTNLRDVRLAKGMQAKDVARKAGVSETAYLAYERGEHTTGAPFDPLMRTLFQLLAALDVGDVSDVLPTTLPSLLAD